LLWGLTEAMRLRITAPSADQVSQIGILLASSVIDGCGKDPAAPAFAGVRRS
jgi:hypothetical protein